MKTLKRKAGAGHETDRIIGRKRRGESYRETESAVAAICRQLQELQRQRVCHLKSRIMLDNRLVSSVAVSLGYKSGLDEDARKKAFGAAQACIERIRRGDASAETENALAPLVLEASRAIGGFDRHVDFIEKAMVKLAKQLPVASWVKAEPQKGFGIKSLAILIGEAGDLSNYANPGKLWRRMGCAPFESQGVMRMGARWKSAKPGLSAAEWEEYGYSPRRRSVAYVFGENLVKQNFVNGDHICETEAEVAGDRSDETESRIAGEPWRETECTIAGPYRRRYDEVKATKLALESDEWPRLRCHRHGMLLAVKLLMRELWKAWNPGRVAFCETEKVRAAY